IQRSQKPRKRKKTWVAVRVASILLLGVMLSSLLYWSTHAALTSEPSKPTLKRYVTTAEQQNIFTLSDGTLISLNEGSQLSVPDKMKAGYRSVTLKGEAYFKVAHDPEHPFVIYANGSTVTVLGTEFNVKADSTAGNVQVAVVE